MNGPNDRQTDGNLELSKTEILNSDLYGLFIESRLSSWQYCLTLLLLLLFVLIVVLFSAVPTVT
jgi:hypothetical protein